MKALLYTLLAAALFVAGLLAAIQWPRPWGPLLALAAWTFALFAVACVPQIDAGGR